MRDTKQVLAADDRRRYLHTVKRLNKDGMISPPQLPICKNNRLNLSRCDYICISADCQVLYSVGYARRLFLKFARLAGRRHPTRSFSQRFRLYCPYRIQNSHIL